MFRFWASDTRGCEKTGFFSPSPSAPLPDAAHEASSFSAAATAAIMAGPGAAAMSSCKRKRSVDPEQPRFAPVFSDAIASPFPPIKRQKSEIKSEAAADDDDDEEQLRPRAAYGDWTEACLGVAKVEGAIPAPPLSPPPSVTPSMADASDAETVRDVLQYEFGLEILLKHGELRLIEQELAKCQIALEQLRRCHLIPYPTACPTPDQMLDIASGRGAAVRPRPGAAVPKWAAPFGVIDGPYARHYAKWLIPDPVFDGPLPNWPGVPQPGRTAKSAATAEARATRNSSHHFHPAAHEAPGHRPGRPSRGVAGQKLHALGNGYPQPKDKVGPCVLKRSDGKVVKLVCIDCHRENFSSTQGFINHCRIAHKRDFKSHEEAAVHCGHPIEVDGAEATKKSGATAPASAGATGPAGPAGGAAPAPVPAMATSSGPTTASASASAMASASAAAAALAAASAAPTPGTVTSYNPVSGTPGHVYPLARGDSETAHAVLRHIEASFKEYSAPTAGSASSVMPLSSSAANVLKRPASSFVGSEKLPYLSKLMERKQCGGSLQELVADTTAEIDLDAYTWLPDEDFDDGAMASASATSMSPSPATPTTTTASGISPAMRMKARPVLVPSASTLPPRPSSSSKGMSPHLSLTTPSLAHTIAGSRPVPSRLFDSNDANDEEEEMDVDMSPNTIASNNAPSLVSDDGEYDDSDDGSSSDTSETDMESVSDVAEIKLDGDEDQVHEPSRPLRHHHRSSASSSSALKLRKDEAKHVAFVSPVRGTSKSRSK